MRPQLSEETRDNDTLARLLEASFPWTVEEVAREVGDLSDAVDALGRLTEAGLVHRVGDFVFPTRAACRAAELQVGTA